MRVKPRLEARFMWNFAEVEYTEDIKERMDALASKIAKQLAEIVGAQPEIDIHWMVDVVMEKLLNLDDVK